ncbi:MAG: hypothetical protein ABWZ25_13115 [Chitinophagaceae bacterium]
MKKVASLLIVFLALRPAICQEILFKSAQVLTAEQVNSFYASFRISGNWILFNAPDFKLYGYEKSSLNLKWEYDLNHQSDLAPYIVNDQVWANGKSHVLKLDLQTGLLIKELPLASIATEPFTSNGKIFGTGIYDGGKIFEFDPLADSILWSRFLAHGSSVQPYYLNNRIVANAENNSWLEMDYSGKYFSSGCEVEGAWPSESPCAKKFISLSHDGKEITEKFAGKLDLGEFTRFTLPHKTFLLCEKRLVILGDGLKVLLNRELSQVSDELLGIYGSDLKILHATDELIWIYESDRIVEYNHRSKKFIRSVDLSEWSPHQVALDGKKIWLISKKDGLLYCMKYL